MPQVVPVSDFRSDVTTVAKYTDNGEVVVLTQNGHPRWAMVDYDEWSDASRAQERAYARALLQTEERERNGELELLAAEDFKACRRERLAALRKNVRP